MDEVQRKKMEIAGEEERTKKELKVLEENFWIKQELAQKEAEMIASMKPKWLRPWSMNKKIVISF